MWQTDVEKRNEEKNGGKDHKSIQIYIDVLPSHKILRLFFFCISYKKKLPLTSRFLTNKRRMKEKSEKKSERIITSLRILVNFLVKRNAAKWGLYLPKEKSRRVWIESIKSKKTKRKWL